MPGWERLGSYALRDRYSAGEPSRVSGRRFLENSAGSQKREGPQAWRRFSGIVSSKKPVDSFPCGVLQQQHSSSSNSGQSDGGHLLARAPANPLVRDPRTTSEPLPAWACCIYGRVFRSRLVYTPYKLGRRKRKLKTLTTKKTVQLSTLHLLACALGTSFWLRKPGLNTAAHTKARPKSRKNARRLKLPWRTHLP